MAGMALVRPQNLACNQELGYLPSLARNTSKSKKVDHGGVEPQLVSQGRQVELFASSKLSVLRNPACPSLISPLASVIRHASLHCQTCTGFSEILPLPNYPYPANEN